VFIVRSHAKLNLCLSITGKRPNGYHNLFSVFCPIGLHDIIYISENSTGLPSLLMKGKFSHNFNNLDVNEIAKNTVIRALKLMHDKYSVPMNFDIIIDKNIPLGAGMGGGSTNAASIITFLNERFALNLSREQMMVDATKIGADVPFCLGSGMALCEGIGEEITDISIMDDDSIYACIVTPNCQLETKNMYASLNLHNRDNNAIASRNAKLKNAVLSGAMEWGDLIGQSKNISNDFVNVAMNKQPVIKQIIDEMSNESGVIYANMSGSGSSCFALLKNEMLCNNLTSHMTKKYPSANIVTTKVLSKFCRQKFSHRTAADYLRNETYFEQQLRKVA
jgi:4-diphosphocytidyl-2-C-methyl-D-erythritol kinase